MESLLISELSNTVRFLEFLRKILPYYLWLSAFEINMILLWSLFEINVMLKCNVCVWGGGVCGGVQIRHSFFSLLYGMPANISRKPATGGMASQHLRTLERMYG